MRFISPRVHGVLDYAVAGALIGVPLGLDFAASSAAAAAISIVSGAGLVVYSLLTDYSVSLRRLIPWRIHLTLDAVAAVALLLAPFVFGFGGVARGFYIGVALSVLAVVAVTQVDPAPELQVSREAAGHRTPA